MFFFSAFFMDDLQECRCDRILPGKSFFCREQFSAGYCLERFISLGNSSLKGTACFFLFFWQGTVLCRLLPGKIFSYRELFSEKYCHIFFGGIVPPKKKCFVLRTFPVKDRFWKCHEVLKEQIKFWSACFLDMKRCQAKKISQQPFLHRRSKEAQSCSCRKKCKNESNC